MEIRRSNILFRYRIFWHILFWVLYYAFYVISYGEYTGQFREQAILNLEIMPVRILATYAMIYYLIPVFLMKNKYVNFIFYTIIHAAIYGFILWMVYYFTSYQYYRYEVQYPFFYWPKILVAIITNYEIIAIAATIKFFKTWHLDQQRKQRLQNEKLEAELKFLKAQIHPHFLFNTINNLYALTLKKSDKAPDVVIRLSQLMDYMLYKSNKSFVPLGNEIDLVKGYIELEKIRYGDRLDVKFELKGNPKGKEISPLLILPFVENSFKHGTSQDTSAPFVYIFLTIEDSAIELTIENSVEPLTEEVKADYTEGIGLQNVRKRLQLLYPDKHELVTKKSENRFFIRLKLMLSQPSG